MLRSTNVVMPSFLVIGAAKAGTTAVNQFFAEHPEVYICPVQEPRFFSFEGQKFSPDHPLHAKTVTTIEEYRALFDGVTDEKAVGEVSPSYLHNTRAPGNIQAHLPDVRLIAVLRNPVDRAYSHFLHYVKGGTETTTDFASALNDVEGLSLDDWKPRRDYVRFGFYHEQLSRYFARFDPKQIKVYLFEDLRREPEETLKDVYRFVGVDDTFLPDYSKQHNVSGIPRSRALRSFLDRPNAAKSFLRRCIPGPVRRRTADIVRLRNLRKPELSKTVRAELVEVFRDDVLQLQELIGRDLSKWLELPAS
ncbi:MAG: sulfotransferase [Planctomycetaceae bacterium]|nr:sulfotransferase [Planctomycetaceae bacterium]